MRYIKVLLLVILFFLVMMFFVQNQSAFSQAVALKLDLLFLPPVESAPLPFYTLLIICFVLGALCILAMLMWDRVSLSAKLTMANMRARSFEKDVAKALKTNEALQKKLDAAEAKAAVITRHQREWDRHQSIMDEALSEGSFDKAKLAKITAETIKIRQEGERKAWGIVDKTALDHTSSDGSLSQRPVDLSHLSPDELLRLTKEAFKTPDHE